MSDVMATRGKATAQHAAGMLTLAEARERLGVSDYKVRLWVKQGTLPAVVSLRDRRVKLVRASDVEQLAARLESGVVEGEA